MDSEMTDTVDNSISQKKNGSDSDDVVMASQLSTEGEKSDDDEHVIAMVHEFVVQRGDVATNDSQDKNDEDDYDDDDDDDPDRYEVEQGENWLRLIVKEGHSVLDDTQDTSFLTHASQVYPSMVSLASVGVLEDVPSQDCFICVDLDQDSLAIKDMRLPLTTTMTPSVANNSSKNATKSKTGDTLAKKAIDDKDDDEKLLVPVIGIARKGKEWEVLPRRQLRMLWPGDRLCTNLYENEPDGLVMEYRFSANRRKRKASDSIERPILEMITQPEESSSSSASSPKQQEPERLQTQSDNEEKSNDNITKPKPDARDKQIDKDDDNHSVATNDSDQTEIMQTQETVVPTQRDDKNDFKGVLEVIEETNDDDAASVATNDSEATELTESQKVTKEPPVADTTGLSTQPQEDSPTNKGTSGQSKNRQQNTHTNGVHSKTEDEKAKDKTTDASNGRKDEDGPKAQQKKEQGNRNVVMKLSTQEEPTNAKEQNDDDSSATDVEDHQEKVKSLGSQNKDEGNASDSDTDVEGPETKDRNVKTEQANGNRSTAIRPLVQEEKAGKEAPNASKKASPAQVDAGVAEKEGTKDPPSSEAPKNKNNQQKQQTKIAMSPGFCNETQDPPSSVIPSQAHNAGKTTQVFSESTGVISDALLRETGEEQHSSSRKNGSEKSPPPNKEKEKGDNIEPLEKDAENECDPEFDESRDDDSETQIITVAKPVDDSLMDDNNDAETATVNNGKAAVQKKTSESKVDSAKPDVAEEKESLQPASKRRKTAGKATTKSQAQEQPEGPPTEANHSTRKRTRTAPDTESSLTEVPETQSEPRSTRKRRRTNAGTESSDSPETPSKPQSLKDRSSAAKSKKEASSARKRTRSSPKDENVGNDVQEIRVLTTGVVLTNAQKHMIKRIGGELLEKVADANMATHVIAGSKGTPMRRTPKLMIGLCGTSNIVSLDWLLHSAKERRPLPAQDYLLVDNEEAENLYNFKMRETLMRAGRMRSEGRTLLGRYSVFMCAGVAGNKDKNNRTPPLEEFRLIVEAAGAKWMKTIPKKTTPGMIILVSKLKKEAKKQMSEKKAADAIKKGAIVKTTEELFHGIMTQQFDS